MRKKLVVLLSLVLVISSLFCGCGNNEANEMVKNDLIGEWSATNSTGNDTFVMYTTNVYRFDEEGVEFYQIFETEGTFAKTSETDPIRTKYSIKKDTIVIKETDGLGEAELNYTYTDGELRLFNKTAPGTHGEEIYKVVE